MDINKVEQFAKNIYGVKVTKNPLGNPMFEFTGTELAMFTELIVLDCVEKLKEIKKVELPFLQATNETIQELPLSVYIAELKAHFGVGE